MQAKISSTQPIQLPATKPKDAKKSPKEGLHSIKNPQSTINTLTATLIQTLQFQLGIHQLPTQKPGAATPSVNSSPSSSPRSVLSDPHSRGSEDALATLAGITTAAQAELASMAQSSIKPAQQPQINDLSTTAPQTKMANAETAKFMKAVDKKIATDETKKIEIESNRVQIEASVDQLYTLMNDLTSEDVTIFQNTKLADLEKSSDPQHININTFVEIVQNLDKFGIKTGPAQGEVLALWQGDGARLAIEGALNKGGVLCITEEGQISDDAGKGNPIISDSALIFQNALFSVGQNASSPEAKAKLNIIQGLGSALLAKKIANQKQGVPVFISAKGDQKEGAVDQNRYFFKTELPTMLTENPDLKPDFYVDIGSQYVEEKIDHIATETQTGDKITFVKKDLVNVALGKMEGSSEDITFKPQKTIDTLKKITEQQDCYVENIGLCKLTNIKRDATQTLLTLSKSDKTITIHIEHNQGLDDTNSIQSITTYVKNDNTRAAAQDVSKKQRETQADDDRTTAVIDKEFESMEDLEILGTTVSYNGNTTGKLNINLNRFEHYLLCNENGNPPTKLGAEQYSREEMELFSATLKNTQQETPMRRTEINKKAN